MLSMLVQQPEPLHLGRLSFQHFRWLCSTFVEYTAILFIDEGRVYRMMKSKTTITLSIAAIAAAIVCYWSYSWKPTSISLRQARRLGLGPWLGHLRIWTKSSSTIFFIRLLSYMAKGCLHIHVSINEISKTDRLFHSGIWVTSYRGFSSIFIS
jgi:hypothetical protein